MNGVGHMLLPKDIFLVALDLKSGMSVMHLIMYPVLKVFKYSTVCVVESHIFLRALVFLVNALFIFSSQVVVLEYYFHSLEYLIHHYQEMVEISIWYFCVYIFSIYSGF